MTGKTILITGGTDGIGLALAQKLVLHNRVIILSRSEEKLQTIFGADSNARTYAVDLSSMDQVRFTSDELISDFEEIDLLIHNASCVSSDRVITKDGFELQLAVNYLAPVVLTSKLLPLLKKNHGSVLFINSRAHKRVKFDLSDPQLENTYGLSKSYNRSKLFLLLFAMRLSELLVEDGVNVHSVHPGLVNTRMGEKQCSTFHRLAWSFMKQLGKSPEIAADNIIARLGSKEFNQTTGHFFGPHDQEIPSSVANDSKAKDDLWILTEKMLQTSIP